eukprot:TRINITY_DN4369_c0_g1_i1.p1 TRINITY_DN4369_c0_g1~~TRINITY_DN4369_c0_g1_i1.p1  ORF type:complete len:695 (+),score=128.58 TRINITY_DN4369_c0_g1_i1:148-2232(+)
MQSESNTTAAAAAAAVPPQLPPPGPAAPACMGNGLRSEIEGLLRKLDQDLWECVSRWQGRQRAPMQLPPLKLMPQEVAVPAPQATATAFCEMREASPRLRAVASEEQPAVQVTDVESPMSQLVPRVLDLSLSSSVERQEDQVRDCALTFSTDTQSESGVLRASCFGPLDFSRSPSPIGTVKSSARKGSGRKLVLAPAWSTGRGACKEECEAVGLLDTALQLPDYQVSAGPSVSSGHPSTSHLLCKIGNSPGSVRGGRLQRLSAGQKRGGRRRRNDSPLAKRRAEQLRLQQSRITRFTRSMPYEVANAAATLLNALFILWQTEHKAIQVDHVPYEDLESAMFHTDIIGDIFCMIFVVDLLLRLAADRLAFFRSREWLWNIFDSAVVLTAVIETLIHWYQWATGTTSDAGLIIGKFSMLRILRLTRVIHGSRFIRTSRFFRELRIMVTSLTGAMRTLVWSVVLMVVMLLVFGVFFTDGAVAFLMSSAKGLHSAQQEEVKHLFGSVPVATVTLYMAVSGGVDWGDIWKALGPLPWEYAAGFLTFMTFTIFALFNVVTSVFVETAMQRSQNDRDLLVQQEMEHKMEFVDTMQRVFEELDVDSSGSLTLDEFEAQLDDEHILSFMSTLELDIDQVRTLLTLLDRDGSGSVDIEEFVEGCLRLKGGAKAMDMAILQYQVEYLVTTVAQLGQVILPASASE